MPKRRLGSVFPVAGQEHEEQKKIRGGWQACNCTRRLEATCEGVTFLFWTLAGAAAAAAGDDAEDTSTEFTDSIEEEAAHNSHQQVSQGQVRGVPGSHSHLQPSCAASEKTSSA